MSRAGKEMPPGTARAFGLTVQPPSPIPVVDHLPGHAAVDADDLHHRALGPEDFGNPLPDTVRAARDDGDLACKVWVYGAFLLLRL